MTDLEILYEARNLLDVAIQDELDFGDGNGANYIIMRNAETMVAEYKEAK